jgi:hypothetical protein
MPALYLRTEVLQHTGVKCNIGAISSGEYCALGIPFAGRVERHLATYQR